MNEIPDLMPQRQTSSFLPVVLVELCILLLTIFQLSMMLPQRTQLQHNIANNEQGVAQAKQAQGNLQKIVEDLIAVSKDDKDAQAIIAKYNIHVTPPAGTAASPAATATDK